MPLSDFLGNFAGNLVGTYQKARMQALGGGESFDSRDVIGAFGDSYAYAKPGSDLNAQKLAIQNSWFLSALLLIMGEAASARLHIVEQAGVDEKPIDFPNHPFEEILYRPNPFMTGDWMMRYSTLWNKSDGNAYWFLLPDSNDILEEIWPLPSDSVWPMTLRGSNNFIDYYEYRAQGRIFHIDPKYICHFQNFPNPFNPFDGLSELIAGSLPISADTAMLRWNAKFFSRDNVMPNAIINLRSGNPARRPAPADIAALKSDLSTDYSAANRKTLVTGAPGGIDVEMLGWSARDMDFVSGRAATKKEIYNLVGVPEGVYDPSATEASAKVAVRILKDTVWTRTLVPAAATITAKIIWPFYGKEFRAIYDDIRPVDKELVIKEQGEDRKVLTLDESRKVLGREEYTGPYAALIGKLPFQLATNPQAVIEILKLEAGVYAKPEQKEETAPPPEVPADAENAKEDNPPEKATFLIEKHSDTAIISIEIPYSFATANMSMPFSAFPLGAEVIPLSDRHITLKYLGNTASLDSEKLITSLRAFTSTEHAFEIELLDEDRFYRASENHDVIYHPVKSSELLSFRERLVGQLKSAGVDIVDLNPNYIPHVTICYAPPATNIHASVPRPGKLLITNITLRFGGSKTRFPLITPEALSDLKKWREKAVRAGKLVDFTSEYIPEPISTAISSNLASLTNFEAAGVKSIFTPYINHEHV